MEICGVRFLALKGESMEKYFSSGLKGWYSAVAALKPFQKSLSQLIKSCHVISSLVKRILFQQPPVKHFPSLGFA